MEISSDHRGRVRKGLFSGGYQGGDAEATAHAPLSGKYALSSVVEMQAFNGISK